MTRASALVGLGRGGEARAFVDGIEAAYGRGEADAAEVAGAWASVGDADRAFEWLQRALEERSMLLFDIRVEPQFHALRDDPRFAALLAAMGATE
jgi:hypothetical protein